MRVSLALLILLLASILSTAQSDISQLNKYSIKVYTTDEGLPSNNLVQVHQDNKGYIWISSFNGLTRFDGNTFDVYDSDLIPQLKSNGFRTISEDSEGNLFFGTLTSGLLKYDGSEFELTKIDGDFSGSVTVSFTDSNGRLWVGIRDKGIFYQDNEQDVLTKVESSLFNDKFIT